MRWFKHETDAHTNMKLQSVINRFGLEGYGYYWACVEMVGKDGKEYRIDAKKHWKEHLKKFLNVRDELQDMLLDFLAESNLIDRKALNKGDLHIPKMAERADDYTNKVRRKYGHSTDNVHLEENRREEEKNRREENRQMFERFWSLYPNKKAKQSALKSFLKVAPDEQLFSEIISGLTKARSSKAWVKDGGQYVPHPTTWLNQQRWTDEHEVEIISPVSEKI